MLDGHCAAVLTLPSEAEEGVHAVDRATTRCVGAIARLAVRGALLHADHGHAVGLDSDKWYTPDYDNVEQGQMTSLYANRSSAIAGKTQRDTERNY